MKPRKMNLSLTIWDLESILWRKKKKKINKTLRAFYLIRMLYQIFYFIPPTALQDRHIDSILTHHSESHRRLRNYRFRIVISLQVILPIQCINMMSSHFNHLHSSHTMWNEYKAIAAQNPN